MVSSTDLFQVPPFKDVHVEIISLNECLRHKINYIINYQSHHTLYQPLSIISHISSSTTNHMTHYINNCQSHITSSQVSEHVSTEHISTEHISSEHISSERVSIYWYL